MLVFFPSPTHHKKAKKDNNDGGIHTPLCPSDWSLRAVGRGLRLTAQRSQGLPFWDETENLRPAKQRNDRWKEGCKMKWFGMRFEKQKMILMFRIRKRQPKKSWRTAAQCHITHSHSQPASSTLVVAKFLWWYLVKNFGLLIAVSSGCRNNTRQLRRGSCKRYFIFLLHCTSLTHPSLRSVIPPREVVT